jgi:hypothetical protein
MKSFKLEPLVLQNDDPYDHRPIAITYNRRRKVSVECRHNKNYIFVDVPFGFGLSREFDEIVREWATNSANNRPNKELNQKMQAILMQVIADNNPNSTDHTPPSDLAIPQDLFAPTPVTQSSPSSQAPNEKLYYRKFPRNLYPYGYVYNLKEIMAQVRQKYFPQWDHETVFISWSPTPGGLSTHSLRKMSDGSLVHLIYISQGYDHKDCPEYAVSGVVFHEFLHIVVPPKKGSGNKRIVHSKEFKQKEKEYEFYQEWMLWHRTKFPKIVRKLRIGSTTERGFFACGANSG